MILQADSSYWEAMKHRHLVLAYLLTWAVQLGYAGWVALRWRRSAK
jgi:hypothetical protein